MLEVEESLVKAMLVQLDQKKNKAKQLKKFF